MTGGSLLIMILFLIQRTNDWGSLLIMILFLIQRTNDWGIFADNDSLFDTEDK